MACNGWGRQYWKCDEEDGPYRILYKIEPALSYNRRLIESAMDEIEKHSRIEFEERYNQRCYLQFTKADGCFFQGASNCSPRISLGIGCRDFGTVLHEIMHAIGFEHEHNRPDRDDFLIIHRENIEPDNINQFRKLSRYHYEWIDFAIDYQSVMMYESYAFSKNGGITIQRRDGGIIRRNDRLSRMDKDKLRML
ncbi:astacin-like metalloprotease toxin 1 [Trichonephila inaurata madagascariensis]|uniref:Metalloendopeptidase n=1 Tax=Trichonephila inaurata madagascariensis TaxID=2747483 RepID=A0A8X7CPX2_9ARAC|nr:astacin-like metalloprotease toxin 1 [Trichonephila inaurata madagascariensis]